MANDRAAGPGERALWYAAAAIGMFALSTFATILVVRSHAPSIPPPQSVISPQLAVQDDAGTVATVPSERTVPGEKTVPILANYMNDAVPADRFVPPELDPAQAARSLLQVLQPNLNPAFATIPRVPPFGGRQPDLRTVGEPDVFAEFPADDSLPSASLPSETWSDGVPPIDQTASSGSSGVAVSVDRIELPAACPDVPVVEFRNLGTALRWAESVDQAAMLAHGQGKMLFVLHVSGNFEDPGFT